MTKKIEVVQDRINLARTQAGSQYGALEEAIDSTTDLRSQFALGSGTLSDLNFSMETVNLTRRQMQQDVASSVLAQANKTQSSLVSLVDGSYRTYLNAQFSHLKEINRDISLSCFQYPNNLGRPDYTHHMTN